jgi:peptide/nickel transport system ATP-binding protein
MVDASLRATILGALHHLHLERGIALLYITHDLVTAYQISHNVIVLYRGTVVEAGAVDLVVKQPQHPYTQLLLASLPVASPERTWSPTTGTGTAGLSAIGSPGCACADRCPRVMAPCLQAPPPLFHTQQQRAVACYLYQGAPALTVAELGQALTAPASMSKP